MAIAYPEAVCLQRQMEEVLVGKRIAEAIPLDITKVDGSWRYDSIAQPPSAFADALNGGTVKGIDRVASSVFIRTDTDHSLTVGYLSGRVIYHAEGDPLPKRRCLTVRFEDGCHLSVVISLWGLIRVLKAAERPAFVEKWYGRGIEPASRAYTWTGFRDAAGESSDPKLSVKKFLHDFGPGYYLSGLDAGYALEVLHHAGIHPKRKLVSLTGDELRACYQSVIDVVKQAIQEGGRRNEVDLYGQPGGYVPHVCRERLGEPCLECRTPIVKFSFEGGTSYACPSCQPAPT